ncbi:hypothetical protein D3C72_2276020 [compost metagenome]
MPSVTIALAGWLPPPDSGRLASITTSGMPLTYATTSGVRWCVPCAASTSSSSVTSQRLAFASAQSINAIVGWCFLPSGMNSVTVMPSASLP